jgi:hypothetical protein
MELEFQQAAPEGLAVVLPVNVLGFEEREIVTSEGNHQVVPGTTQNCSRQ